MGRSAALGAVAIIFLAVALAGYFFLQSAPTKSLTISAGPEGSMFYRAAQKYATNLALDHVKLTILTSQGSEENLARLSKPVPHVDIGFVQGGVTNVVGSNKLVSLGSVAYEPMMIFYPAALKVTFLSDLAGKRIAVGPPGSGTRSLALILLGTNGITPGGATTLLDTGSDEAVTNLLQGKVDAVFVMSDSVSSQSLRQLTRNPAFKLYDFTQATGYTRRIPYLTKIEMPQGSMDFGKNIPAQDIHLVGPTVDLIVRADLHPALSDLLLDAAREIHGKPGLFQSRGEFPAAMEHDFPLSPDASRYYKTGKSFLYRRLPFWLAGLVTGVVVVFLPMTLLLIPALRMIPAVFRLRVKFLMFRWYRELLSVERALLSDTPPAEPRELLQRLDKIEATVKTLKVPASYADQFYGLRGHISFVRQKLTEAAARG